VRLANYLESEFYDGGDFVCGMFSMCYFFHDRYLADSSWPTSFFVISFAFVFSFLITMWFSDPEKYVEDLICVCIFELD
jgi:hypothetical protein